MADLTAFAKELLALELLKVEQDQDKERIEYLKIYLSKSTKYESK